MTRFRSVVLAALALAACGNGASPGSSLAALSGPADVTILYTTDEHGWLLSGADKGKTHGGAAEMLGIWVAREGHCAGPRCEHPRTLALSGGDNYTGPAVSTYFDGKPMAEALARMGYAASAFGNHEFDFGRAAFLENRRVSGMTYLAANLRAPASLPEMQLPAFSIFERRGIKIGVVGLATDTTLRSAMAKRFEGITFEEEEPALDRGVRAAWGAGADAVVVIAHECPDKLAPIVERHPDWKLSFVGGGHCHKVMSRTAGGVPVIAPGWRLDGYLRVVLHTDAGKPAGRRVLSVDHEIVTTSRDAGTPPAAPPDPVLAQAAEGWREKVDRALGEEIGWSTAGIDKGSPEMTRWIAGALRAETGAELAIVNAQGIRQSLPPGPVTKASVWSILPFDNRVLTFRIDGEALASNLKRHGALIAGARRDGERIVLDDGRVVTPGGVYTAATIDFLYFGGDGFTFEKHAQGTTEGPDWREVVIAWTRKLGSGRAAPLEARLPR